MKVHKLLACYSYFCKQSVFDGTIKLECLRTTGPLFRTYEPSDYRTFITESCKSRYRTYEPSDCRTFGMKNPLFRTHEPSDYRTFGLERSHRPSPVHLVMSSSHLLLCPPRLLVPSNVPRSMVFDSPVDLITWPYHLSLRFLTMDRSSSYGPPNGLFYHSANVVVCYRI